MAVEKLTLTAAVGSSPWRPLIPAGRAQGCRAQQQQADHSCCDRGSQHTPAARPGPQQLLSFTRSSSGILTAAVTATPRSVFSWTVVGIVVPQSRASHPGTALLRRWDTQNEEDETSRAKIKKERKKPAVGPARSPPRPPGCRAVLEAKIEIPDTPVVNLAHAGPGQEQELLQAAAGVSGRM